MSRLAPAHVTSPPFYMPATRVTVTAGSLQGLTGAVIRDEGFTDTGRVTCDRVWVLLDVGDNPQHFKHHELAEA